MCVCLYARRFVLNYFFFHYLIQDKNFATFDMVEIEGTNYDVQVKAFSDGGQISDTIQQNLKGIYDDFWGKFSFTIRYTFI